MNTPAAVARCRAHVQKSRRIMSTSASSSSRAKQVPVARQVRAHSMESVTQSGGAGSVPEVAMFPGAMANMKDQFAEQCEHAFVVE